MKKKFLVKRVIDSGSVYITEVEAISVVEAVHYVRSNEGEMEWELQTVREYDRRVFYAEEA